jgi:NADH:ubiquinone oxidoreductase subunit 3 (subunit A)
MSNATFWFSPPILIIIFMVLGALLLLMGRVISAKGEYNRTKHLHYSCGEDLDAPHVQVSYHAFFRLALLFSILHIVALVISTIDRNADNKIHAVLYLIDAGVCIFILLERNEQK